MLGACGLTLSGWGLRMRGIRAAVPAVCAETGIPDVLGALGQETSDYHSHIVEKVAASQGLTDAADLAKGHADVYARFAQRHPKAFDQRTRS